MAWLEGLVLVEHGNWTGRLEVIQIRTKFAHLPLPLHNLNVRFERSRVTVSYPHV